MWTVISWIFGTFLKFLKEKQIVKWFHEFLRISFLITYLCRPPGIISSSSSSKTLKSRLKSRSISSEASSYQDAILWRISMVSLLVLILGLAPNCSSKFSSDVVSSTSGMYEYRWYWSFTSSSSSVIFSSSIWEIRGKN